MSHQRGARNCELIKYMTNVIPEPNSESNDIRFMVDVTSIVEPITKPTAIPSFSQEYERQWTCGRGEYCYHPACVYCGEKHLFLCEVDHCSTRICLCSECWKKFNETEQCEH